MALIITKKDPVAVGERWKDFDSETKILIAGIDNKQYQLGLERLRRRIRANDAQFEQGAIGLVEGETTEHEGQCLLLSQYVVRDWTGVVDGEGNPVKYSPEAACALLQNQVAFFLFVLKSATEVTASKAGEIEETLKK